jgi:hypothetical protein
MRCSRPKAVTTLTEMHLVLGQEDANFVRHMAMMPEVVHQRLDAIQAVRAALH